VFPSKVFGCPREMGRRKCVTQASQWAAGQRWLCHLGVTVGPRHGSPVRIKGPWLGAGPSRDGSPWQQAAEGRAGQDREVSARWSRG